MPSLQDVASLAGVSISTASRALNGTKLADRLSPGCIERVRAAAQAVGYTAGYHRRAIRSGHAEVLGVALEQTGPTNTPLFPSPLESPYVGQIVAGVEQATHAAGYNLALIVPSRSRRANARGVQQLTERRIDGLVLPPCNTLPENTQTLREAPHLPIVAVQPCVPTELPSVLYDSEDAVGLAVRHLADLGHRSLLYFGPAHDGNHGPAFERERHFFATIARLGMRGDSCLFRLLHDPLAPVPADKQRAEREARFDALLQTATDSADGFAFTGVVAFNDVSAVAACRVLEHHGLHVPRDVSVTGIDSIDPDYMTIPLTSVDLRLTELGLIAGQWLLALVQGGDEAVAAQRNRREVVLPRLWIRGSSGPPPRT